MSNSTKDSESSFGNFTVEEVAIRTAGEMVGFVFLCIVLGIIILGTIVGNVFVMVAIVKDKNLNNLSNYLVFSLALADLLVAILVMPVGAVYQVNGDWTMGPELCDMWTSCDVLCCTASILHLLAIAMDRYWAVTNVDYARNRDKKKIYTAILLVWVISFTVSMAPFFGWKDSEFTKRIEVDKECMVSQDVGYQVFATCSSFYVPLVLILILYSRIFQEARRRIRRRPGAASQAMLLIQKPPPITENKVSSSPENTSNAAVTPSKQEDTVASYDTVVTTADNDAAAPPSNGSAGKSPVSSTSTAVVRLLHFAKRSDNKKPPDTLAKREKKAAKTLAIITGVFVICWLPFFVMALLLPLCESCEPNSVVISFFLWLGYANSMLNPIIYTIFSPDFRSAFRKLLCGNSATQRPVL